jgi:hypothetical protein
VPRCRIWVKKTKKKERGLESPRRRWEDTIVDLILTDWGGMDWIHVAEDRDQWRALVNTVMNLRVP